MAPHPRPRPRRDLRPALCALALGLGAFVGWVTEPVATATPAAREPPSAAATSVSVATVANRAPRPEPSDEPSDATVSVPVAGPFGEGLAGGKVITGHTPHRLILFTFDDGPDDRNTPRLLRLLDARGIKAVFFLTAGRLRGDGPRARRRREIARDILLRGHTVGNHTIDHVQLPLLLDVEVEQQVRGADEVFEKVLGRRTWLIRPPGGARSARTDRLLAGWGYGQVLWNLGTGDAAVRTGEEAYDVFRRMLRRRRIEFGDEGGIVLLHDIHEWSVDAFVLIHRYLERRNCQLLAKGEELFDIVDDPGLFFAPREGADPTAEAPAAVLTPAALEARQRRLRARTRARCAEGRRG
ncbi:MAG: polysaccharide deacetylase family protein [Sandaracinaceae bacterium]